MSPGTSSPAGRLQQFAVAAHPGLGDEHLAQRVERLLGPVLLDEADDGVEQHHDEHDERCLQLAGDDEGDDGGADQDEDQQVGELGERVGATPASAAAAASSFGPNSRESPCDLGGDEADSGSTSSRRRQRRRRGDVRRRDAAAGGRAGGG